MPTFDQALLLGTERLNAPPTPPHPLVEEAWGQLDWTGSRETALLDAAALFGAAISAGRCAQPRARPSESAAEESRAYAPPQAVAILPQLLTEEWGSLLPEWLSRCNRCNCIVPPYFLPKLFERSLPSEERHLLRTAAGARGVWLAGHNPNWAWLLAAAPESGPGDNLLWETGNPLERLAWLERMRRHDPTGARVVVEKTWKNEAPDFRLQCLSSIHATIVPEDESFLQSLLKERRKDLRQMAQASLARLPNSGLSLRMHAHAMRLLRYERGLLSKKLEVALPAGFDPEWQADGVEEKAPTGIGEKAHWTQQILSLIPVRAWTTSFNLETERLVELAVKSRDWADLLLGSWFRAACLHKEGEVCAVLLPQLLNRQKAWPSGSTQHSVAVSLLEHCDAETQWRLAATLPEIVWSVLPKLTGIPRPTTARAVLGHLCQGMRDGYNPGGSAAAIQAAKRMPFSLAAEARALLKRESGFSKAAEAFLRALELREAIHAAFPPLSNTKDTP